MNRAVLVVLSVIVVAGLLGRPAGLALDMGLQRSFAQGTNPQVVGASATTKPDSTTQPGSAAQPISPTSVADAAGAPTSAADATVAATQAVNPGPPPRRDKIAEADALMMTAMDAYRKLPQSDRSDLRIPRAVLDQLLKVIHDYPQSDQVDHAYFYAAELLKEYLDDPKAAVEYYQRAYQADPATPHPARFQRAMLLDYRLHRPADALEEYRAVLQFEANLKTPWARSNADFAAVRIRYLTEHK